MHSCAVEVEMRKARISKESSNYIKLVKRKGENSLSSNALHYNSFA